MGHRAMEQGLQEGEQRRGWELTQAGDAGQENRKAFVRGGHGVERKSRNAKHGLSTPYCVPGSRHRM